MSVRWSPISLSLYDILLNYRLFSRSTFELLYLNSQRIQKILNFNFGFLELEAMLMNKPQVFKNYLQGTQCKFCKPQIRPSALRNHNVFDADPLEGLIIEAAVCEQLMQKSEKFWCAILQKEYDYSAMF